MNLPRIGLLALLLLLAASVAWGQTHSYATKGTVELGGGISFASVTNVSDGESGHTASLLVISPRFGYFPIQGLEIGFNPGISNVEIPPGLGVLSSEGRSSTTTAQLFAFAAYNFQLEGSSILPFVEVPFGYTYIGGTSPESGFSWGLRGGIKIVPVEHLLLSIAAEYWQLTFNESGASSRSGANLITIGVGVGGFF